MPLEKGTQFFFPHVPTIGRYLVRKNILDSSNKDGIQIYIPIVNV